MPGLISGASYTGLVANGSQNTDTYYWNSQLLMQPKTGLRFGHHGTIVEGATPQTVTFGVNGIAQANELPPIALPTSVLVASTTFDYDIEWLFCSNGRTGAASLSGDVRTRFTASKDGSPAINPIIAVMENVAWGMNLNLNPQDGTILPLQPLMGFINVGAAGPTVNTYGSTFEVFPYGG